MNKCFKKYTDQFVSIAAFIMSCFFMAGCENNEGIIGSLTERTREVEEARTITSYFSQQGIMKAKLTAPLMLRYPGDTVYVEFPKSLHVDFYDTTTQIESRLDALYGKYFESENKVFLRDSVVVINVKGDTLWSPELWWDQKLEKFYTDKPVRYHTQFDRIIGNHGLDVKQDLSGVIFHYPTGVIIRHDSLQ
jgi:LPS export ABC transporter protein LptC